MTLHVACGGDFMSQPYVAGALDALRRHTEVMTLTATSMATFTAVVAALRPQVLPELWSVDALGTLGADDRTLSSYNEFIVGRVAESCRALLAAGGDGTGRIERLRFARTQMFQGDPVLKWAIYQRESAAAGLPNAINEWWPTTMGPASVDEILIEAIAVARAPFEFRAPTVPQPNADFGAVDIYVDPTAETWIAGRGYEGSPFRFGDALVTRATALAVGRSRRVAPLICLPLGATLFGRIVAFVRPELRRFDHVLGFHDAVAALGHPPAQLPLPELPEALYDGLTRAEADRIRSWLEAVVLPTTVALLFTQQPSWIVRQFRGMVAASIGARVARYLEANMNQELAQRRAALAGRSL